MHRPSSANTLGSIHRSSNPTRPDLPRELKMPFVSKNCSRPQMAAIVLVAPMAAGTARACDDKSTRAVKWMRQVWPLAATTPSPVSQSGSRHQGDVQFTAKDDGATYRVASAANLDAFVKEPAKYSPAFGGYCAMGTVFEKKLDGYPNLLKVVDGKRYLNVGEPRAKRWPEDGPGSITKAAQRRPKISTRALEHPFNRSHFRLADERLIDMRSPTRTSGWRSGPRRRVSNMIISQSPVSRSGYWRFIRRDETAILA